MLRRCYPYVMALVLVLAGCGAPAGAGAPRAVAPAQAAATVTAEAAPAIAATPAEQPQGMANAAGSTGTAEPARSQAGSGMAAATQPAAAPTTAPAGAASAPAEASAAAPMATATGTSAPTQAPASSPTTLPAAAAAPSTACTPGALTPAQTEGPYYKANPPANANLLQPGLTGARLTVTGYVFDAACRPIPGARVDFWQADSEGQYDNQGYTMRGYQLTDAQGRYAVETVVPGLYPGRTRHIHVKITPPGGAMLTTQLYFPGEPANNRDGIFSPQMVMQIQKTANGEVGTFNFVVQG